MNFKKTVKVVVSVLLAVVMCLPASLPVCAASPALSIAGPASVKPDETFSITVSVNDNPGIASYRIIVNYDTSKLVLVDAEATGKMANKNVTFNIDQSGSAAGYREVVAFYYSPNNTNVSGEFIKVTFRVVSGVSSENVGITAEMEEAFNQKYETVSFNSDAKAITISAGSGNEGSSDTASKTIALKKNAKNIKYIKGYSDGTFRPNQAATRYEVVEALAKVFDINVTSKPSGLLDVDPKYAAQVNLFTTAGIIHGFPDKTFGGTQNIKRSEFCKIIAVMMDLNIKNPKNGGFKDVSGWAKVYIDACAEAGLVKGKDEAKKLFDPSANITRAELATLVNRITGALDSGTSCKYSDVKKGTWYYGWVAAAAE